MKLNTVPSQDQIKILENLNLKTIAWLLGVTTRTIQNKHFPKNPNGKYDCRNIIQFIRDGLLESGQDVDSPALERFRNARASLSELELERVRGSLVNVGNIQDHLRAISKRLRECSDRLEKRFGRDAKEMLNETLLSYEKEIEEMEVNENGQK